MGHLELSFISCLQWSVYETEWSGFGKERLFIAVNIDFNMSLFVKVTLRFHGTQHGKWEVAH